MRKFTPGPWIKTSLGRIVMTKETKESVCRLASRADADEQDANARLIAAAPDLLAALEWFISSRRVPPKYPSAGWLAAVAAIAKAKGE